MDIMEALLHLEINEKMVNETIIKTHYRRLCSHYHPDRNPNGLEKMKLINVSYEKLKSYWNDEFLNPLYEQPKPKRKSEFELLKEEINKMHGVYFTEDSYEKKLWIRGKTYDYKEKLKSLRCRWEPKMKMWYSQTY